MYISDIIIFYPDRFSVMLLGIFNIHCHIIDQSCFHKPDQLIRKASVGVQFHIIPYLFDLPDKFFDPVLYQWLSAADAHAVKDPLAFGEKSENLLFRYGLIR